MKKVAFLLAAVLVLVSCGKQAEKYTVNGTIEGVEEGEAVLQKIESGQPVPVDTAQIASGQFTFTGSAEHPAFHLVYVNDNRVPVTFFLENGDITINGHVDSLQNVEVKGSPLTDQFQKFNDGVPSNDRAQELQQEFMQARQSGDQQKMKELAGEYQAIMQEQQQYYKDYVNENTDNAVGAFLGMNLAKSMGADELDTLISSFQASLPGHPYVQEMKNVADSKKEQAEAKSAIQVGKTAPNFTLPDTEGEEVSLNEFEGKYVLLDFWASWCSPCRKENPNMVKAYKEFGGENFEIVGVSLDKTKDPWMKAIEEDNITWTQLHDPKGEVANTYGVQSIPFTLLLNKEGEIIEKNLRGEALQNKLNEIL